MIIFTTSRGAEVFLVVNFEVAVHICDIDVSKKPDCKMVRTKCKFDIVVEPET